MNSDLRVRISSNELAILDLTGILIGQLAIYDFPYFVVITYISLPWKLNCYWIILPLYLPGARLQAHGARGPGDGVEDYESPGLEAREAVSQRRFRSLQDHQCQGEEQKALSAHGAYVAYIHAMNIPFSCLSNFKSMTS